MNNLKQNEEAKIGLVNSLKKEIPNCTIVLDIDENERVLGYCAVNLDGQVKFSPKKGATILINGARAEVNEVLEKLTLEKDKELLVSAKEIARLKKQVAYWRFGALSMTAAVLMYLITHL